MRRLPPLLTLVLIALALAGCGQASSSGSAADSPTEATSSTSASESTSSSPTAKPIDVRRDDSKLGAAFVTPSGNISCYIDTGKAEGVDKPIPTTGCSIWKKSWKAPPSKCDLDYGSLMSFSGKKPTVFDCRGDIPTCYSPVRTRPDMCGDKLDGLWWHQTSDGVVKQPDGNNEESDVLPYGSAIAIGTVTCTSRTTGVTCADSATGQGFTISRAAYSLTPKG